MGPEEINPVGNSLYESFHGTKPNLRKIKYTPPKSGEKLLAIGRVLEVTYAPYGSSTRKGIAYRHRYGDTGQTIIPGRPLLAVSQNGKRFYLIPSGSKAHFTSRGITG